MFPNLPKVVALRLLSSTVVAEQFGIHRSTLYRHLNARQKRSA